MSKFNTQDLTFTIPDYETDADMPAIFEKHADGMPPRTTVSNPLSRVDQEVKDEDINKIFDFAGDTNEEDPIPSTLKITTGKYWKQDDEGNDYGFQFGVATQNDLVEIKPEEGVSVLPYNAVPPNSLAIITRISATTWLVVGGVATTKDFILNESLLGMGDVYGGVTNG